MERLADVVVALGEPAGVRAGDVCGRHMAVALQAAAVVGQLGQLEHAAGAFEVDLAGLLQGQRERHRRGAVDDRRDPLGDPLTVTA